MSGAVIILHQNRLMRRFREVGATTPVEARSPDQLACRYSWVFRRRVARRVFVETKSGRYYLDEITAGEFVRQRRSRVLWLSATAIVLWLLVLLVMSIT